jgi:hypothetical protein
LLMFNIFEESTLNHLGKSFQDIHSKEKFLASYLNYKLSFTSTTRK